MPTERSKVELFFAQLGLTLLALSMVGAEVVTSYWIGASLVLVTKMLIPGLVVGTWTFVCGEVVRRAILGNISHHFLPEEKEG